MDNVVAEENKKKYRSMITDEGTGRMMQAVAEGKKVGITDFSVGDGGGNYYIPDKAMTELKNELWRGKINSCEISEESPNILIITAICPGDVGGFTIREMAVFTADNCMIAICNSPDTPKVKITDGAINELRIEMEIALLNGEEIELVVDPNIVTATKADIDKLWKQIQKNGKFVVGTKDTPIGDNDILVVVDNVPWEAESQPVKVFSLGDGGVEERILTDAEERIMTMETEQTEEIVALYKEKKDGNKEKIHPETVAAAVKMDTQGGGSIKKYVDEKIGGMDAEDVGVEALTNTELEEIFKKAEGGI